MGWGFKRAALETPGPLQRFAIGQDVARPSKQCISFSRTVETDGHLGNLGRNVRIAPCPWLTRRGIHYGWLMVAMTFLTTICSSAAISLSGILVLPLIQEFGWGRADIAAVMGLMLLLFAGTAPFAGAIMLRYGLCRTVAMAVGVTLLGLG